MVLMMGVITERLDYKYLGQKLVRDMDYLSRKNIYNITTGFGVFYFAIFCQETSELNKILLNVQTLTGTSGFI